MQNARRATAVPQLEIIRGSDDTVRAELIALPLVRTATDDRALDGPAGAALAHAVVPPVGPSPQAA
jgi:hypothetical protein